MLKTDRDPSSRGRTAERRLALALLALAGTLAAATGRSDGGVIKFGDVEYPYEASHRIVTSGAPGHGPDDPTHLVRPPAFDGVAQIFINTSQGVFSCTGSLLSAGGRRFLLTAAHCLTDALGNDVTRAVTAFFDTSPTSFFSVQAVNWHINPAWDGDLFTGTDIALIEFAAPVTGVSAYDLYTGRDEVGRIAELVGYGRSGTGDVGAVRPVDFLKRRGTNRLDTDGSDFGVSPEILFHDFDNGRPENDAFGFLGGPAYADLGVGPDEVNTASGDSGGPSFIDGKIAGVTSFGLRFLVTPNPDIDDRLNFSFGEISATTRVSGQMAFINQIVPEPSSFALAGIGGTIALACARRRRRAA